MLEAEAASVIPGAVNSNFRLAAVPPHRFWDRAQGSRLTDVDGNEFIDYVLGMGTAMLGHSPAPLLARVAQAQQLLQCPAGQQVAKETPADGPSQDSMRTVDRSSQAELVPNIPRK